MKDLGRWPLLIAGLTVLGLDIGLIADGADKTTAIALLFGVGSVMVGAGIAHVIKTEPPGADEAHLDHHDKFDGEG